MTTTMVVDKTRIEIEESEETKDFNFKMKVLSQGCTTIFSASSQDSSFHSDILTTIELQIYKIELCYKQLV